MGDVIKVKATQVFKMFRNTTLGLPKKKYRDLQAGKVVNIPREIYKKYILLFLEVKENGD